MSSDEDRLRREQDERERNRREVEKRPRQWVVASDDDDEKDGDEKRRHEKRRRSRSTSSSDSDRHHSRKHRHKHSKRKRHKKKKKHHKKKRHRREYSSDEYSSSDESSRDGHRDKKRKKEKKRKKDKPAASLAPDGAATFGKYGILKPSDYYKQQRSFEIWMAEVKGIPSFTGPKWELQNYFAEYCEDYNTATMPHVKYYNYDEWEMNQYKEQQQETSAKGGVIADEAQHRAQMLKQRREKEQAELELVKARMGRDKVDEMKHQALLKSKMAHAFKMGDEETRQRLQKKLEPEDDRNKKAAAHPWAR